MAEDTDTVSPNRPKAVPRSGPRKRVWISPEDCGVSSPAEAPCSSRAAMSTSMPGARPAAALLAMKPLEPEEHEPPAAPGVTQAAAGDQHQTEGQGVAGDHPLHRAGAGAETRCGSRAGRC